MFSAYKSLQKQIVSTKVYINIQQHFYSQTLKNFYCICQKPSLFLWSVYICWSIYNLSWDKNKTTAVSRIILLHKTCLYNYFNTTSLELYFLNCITRIINSNSKSKLFIHLEFFITFEPRHDKINMCLRPAWSQTSLRIRVVWSGSMLFTISFSTCNRVCKRIAWILIRLRRWSGSMLVASALCWFCHGAAHM
jgi:hypothetical protein